MRPYTEEPGAEQCARPVLDWRRRGRPLRRPYGKQRPLGILTMHDRAMQALYLLALDPVAEVMADPNSYGFRRHAQQQMLLKPVSLPSVNRIVLNGYWKVIYALASTRYRIHGS
jgi:hypothetical protein